MAYRSQTPPVSHLPPTYQIPTTYQTCLALFRQIQRARHMPEGHAVPEAGAGLGAPVRKRSARGDLSFGASRGGFLLFCWAF